MTGNLLGRRDPETNTHTGEHRVKIEVEIGVMQLQDKALRGLSATAIN